MIPRRKSRQSFVKNDLASSALDFGDVMVAISRRLEFPYHMIGKKNVC